MQNSREKRRNTRITLKEPIKVVLGSIGSAMRYELTTRNVSVTGFFLEFEKPGRFPFTPASILEVWLHTSDHAPVFFNGKMARVVFPGDPHPVGPGIAIKIVQIERKDDESLKSFVEEHAASLAA